VASQALLRYARDGARAGLARLVLAQDADGLWRDYALDPGPSEGWSTSWIGWHLAQFTPRPERMNAVRRAAGALARIRIPGGWGYNRTSGSDADSTAWAIRFLRQAGVRCGRAEGAQLAQYLDGEGRAHTFEHTKYGTWADAHDDVTPIVGLALLSCDGRNEALNRIRCAVTNDQRAVDGLWTSFWWASDAYASFWSIYFLRRSGGLPNSTIACIRTHLPSPPTTITTLDAALWRLLLLELRHRDLFMLEHLVDVIISGRTDKGWAGSSLLLVPLRSSRDAASLPGPHADTRGLMTTAVACWALTRWVEQADMPDAPRDDERDLMRRVPI
jgi:hypothetical protein